MSSESVNPGSENGKKIEVGKEIEGEADVPVDNVGTADSGGDPAPAERWVETAREQATEAAEAFRRGEFMSDQSIDPNANSDDKLIAFLCYITQLFVPVVMPLIVLFSESSKKRPFQRYHAVHSLALTVIIMLVLGVMSIGGGILFVIPIIGWLIGGLLLCLVPIAGLMAIVATLYYGLQAYQGKRFAIPGLTSILQEQGWV
jgi:uncharacterized membrane protein